MSKMNKIILFVTLGILGLSILDVCIIMATAETPDKPVTTKPTSDELLSRFNQELSKTLDTKHTIEMQALGEQRALLEGLTQKVAALEEQSTTITDIKTTLTALVAKPEPLKAEAPQATPAKATPVRSVNLTYAVDNSWDATETELYNHLLEAHEFDADGYSLEQMTIIHDNLHAGYPALGGTPQQPQSVQYYNAPVRRGLFSRGFSAGAACIGGSCN